MVRRRETWSTPEDVTATLRNGGLAQIVEMACPAAADRSPA